MWKLISYITFVYILGSFIANYNVTMSAYTGAVVERLEWLGYGAERRRKVVSLRLGFAMQRLENSFCPPNS